MEKQNKYRGELREHFLATRNEPKRDKNGHRIPMDEDRPYRERFHYMENSNQCSTHTFLMDARDNSIENLKCPSGRCVHPQYDARDYRAPPEPAPAPAKLSRNYDNDHQYHHQQHPNHCNCKNSRKPSHNTRNPHRDTEPERAEGGADCLVYKNPGYREPTSDRAEDDLQDPVPVYEYNHKQYQVKDPPHKDYEKARSHCAATDKLFRHKYGFLSDDSGTSKKSKPSQNTVISAKSGKDIRSLIRSQIHLQQALDHSLTHVDRGTPPREVYLGDDKKENDKMSGLEKVTSPTMNKLRTPKRLPEDIDMVITEPELDKFSPIDPKSDMFSVSADDVVSSRVIDPMIRKIQKMYLNTLREEMSIMEYLGKVPRMVSDVYRGAAGRDNRKSSDFK
ncbi:uncharacterized protein [Drosophila kikkawai]|uniref:Uncharacterized protein n=1 Tax=Drosophila kikkawai TaxID=30033 RepID=A0A6P4IK88_DROKI|nr:uncharacterized protein LOC108079578 [Drosophila kikkawai]